MPLGLDLAKGVCIWLIAMGRWALLAEHFGGGVLSGQLWKRGSAKSAELLSFSLDILFFETVLASPDHTKSAVSPAPSVSLSMLGVREQAKRQMSNN